MSLFNHIAIRLMIGLGRQSLSRMEKAGKKGPEINKALLFSILCKNRNCEFGKAHGFAGIRTVNDFRRSVPLADYESYAKDIARMEEGRKKVLTAYRVLSFARTSGSVGSSKHIPLTHSHLKIYLRYTITRALALADKQRRAEGRRPLRSGRIIGALASEAQTLPNGYVYSNVADIGARRLGFFYPYILTQPTRGLFSFKDGDVWYLIARYALSCENSVYFFTVFASDALQLSEYIKDNWQMLVDDIARGKINPGVEMKESFRRSLEKKFRPMPRRAQYLKEQFEAGIDATIFKRLWPKMELYSAIGTASFEIYAQAFAKVSEGIHHDNLIYGASEGLFAAADSLDSTGLLLLPDSCFYEFIPAGQEEGPMLLMDQLEEGKEYELVITNAAGLYRYRIGDIVRVLGFKGRCPYIVFVRRKGELISLCGEKTTQEQIRSALDLLEKEAGCSIVNWSVCEDGSEGMRRYMLLLENESGLDLAPYSNFMDSCLAWANERYADFVGKHFAPAVIVNQIPGTHEKWREQCINAGTAPAQYKPVHFLNTGPKREFFLSAVL